ncbi:MAG TPA: DUF3761 domain-containing protein [Rhodanobacter sp.]
MKASIVFSLAFGCLLAMPAVQAQQSAAPAGSTGQCKDGSYTSNATKRGSCKGHKGVKEWYAADATPAKASKKAAAAEAATPAAAAPAAAPKKSMAWTKPAATAAPGGGPGMVWVNDSSKVYHCPGDKWYGKTKHGEYMSEADAKAKGNHPERGKACKP